ncbi:MAG: pyruvate:ferredoxin (flavodoxin) oxidoreductase, partial [Candidatus Omnitrophica bacterium]|nr:pyruvate:ferredoxin (flavodoxin) oxidoreductase [Candidatus Omnitrophota bacterium]
HSDVMAARATGFAFLCSASVQEAMDFALIAQAATLKTRIPFVHFFDGFRTSHEVSKVNLLSEDVMRAMISERLIDEHRARSLSPDHPTLHGTSQNPDVYFQARETVNPYYAVCPRITQELMDQFAHLVGRRYRLYEYYGAPDAERVVVLMGSGAEAACETVDYLNQQGGKVGVVKVRLFRPFDIQSFIEAFPSSTKSVVVLDRTKEPGSSGEPLYLDCVNAFQEGLMNGWGSLKFQPTIVGGRYGLSSKEFTPAMIQAAFDNLLQDEPKNHFTVGIHDDVTHTSLSYDPNFSVESDQVIRALFYGVGSDGTVGANKNSIKIIGENTDYFVQGYFVYDSKKAGAVTVSHLRFGPKPIRSTYLITEANFIGCHQPLFIDHYDILKHAAPGGTFLFNTSYGSNEVWDHLPRVVQEQIIEKKLRFYVIDAYKVAGECGMGGHINTTMQVCFFAISGVLPKEDAIEQIKESIRKTYGKKGEEVVQQNLNAVDHALVHLFEVTVPNQVTSKIEIPPPIPCQATEFIRDVLGKMIEGEGNDLPVSALPCDGVYPTGTAKWEKRNLAIEIPVWESEVCIQCGKCAMVCPHSVIRIKVYDPQHLEQAPPAFKWRDTTDLEWKGLKYTIQVAPEDCTGCGICVDVCPAKSKTQPELKALNMHLQGPLRDQERVNWDFFLTLPELDRRKIKSNTIRQQQVQEPLFEFSSACSGCGETPYIKLVTQLFGDRTVVANATGCSSIYGGNLPTTPWTKNREGRGPAWANSLFEDNAEFGLGMRLSLDKQKEFAAELLKKLALEIGGDLAAAILTAEQKSEADIYEQRERISILKERLAQLNSPEARRLLNLADMLVKKSVWIIGGDGWAYDIGFGGLDHVLASGQNVNILVLDTEVYSNTGGQMSKSTPRAAVARFAASGKPSAKKDLGLIAMTYGNVYVARVAMGARDEHTLKSFLEAEAYEGPSLIIAYSHCIEHGINMTTAMQNQKVMVDSGQWLLYRFNPARFREGQNPLQLDSRMPKLPVEKFLYLENRFRMLTKSKPEEAKRLMEEVQQDVYVRWQLYEYLSAYKKAQDTRKE